MGMKRQNTEMERTRGHIQSAQRLSYLGEGNEINTKIAGIHDRREKWGSSVDWAENR
jgi:hypothetical protein